MNKVRGRMPGSPARLLTIGCLAVISLLLALASYRMLLPGYYLSTGNLHDIFIPYNAALSAAGGAILHQDFHSPLGWVYSTLNLNAWRLVTQPGSSLGINDLIVVASLLWSAAIAGAYCIFLALLPRPSRPGLLSAWLIGLFLLLTAFNFRGASLFHTREITWYGTYNCHLWALLYLQMLGAFLFLRQPPATRTLLPVAMLQAICAWVALNYKISFGIAATLLAFVPLLSAWRGLAWRSGYAAVVASILAVLFLLLSSAGYDTRTYLDDLGVALAAKSGQKTIFKANLVLTATAVAYLVFAMGRALHAQLPPDPGRLSRNWQRLHQLGLGAGITLAVSLGIAGDFARPTFNLVLALALYGLTCYPEQVTATQQRTRWVAIGCCLALSLSIAVNLTTNLRIATYKQDNPPPRSYSTVRIPTVAGELAWHTRSAPKYTGATRMFKLANSPDRLAILTALAFGTNPAPETGVVRFSNIDYVNGLVAARRFLGESANDIRHTRVLMLEFTNPMPLLLGTPFPGESLHWIHFGTSLPRFGRDEVLFRMLENADLVVVPVLSVDGKDQRLLNCKFQTWNESRGFPLVPYGADESNLYYSRNPPAGAIKALMAPELGQGCEALAARLRKR